MNDIQKAVCLAYGDGDFAYIAGEPNWRELVSACGDTLFRFIMVELSTEEDCEDIVTAFFRLRRARADIECAMLAIERMAENHQPEA